MEQNGDILQLVDENYLKMRRLRNAVTIKRNLSKIDFD